VESGIFPGGPSLPSLTGKDAHSNGTLVLKLLSHQGKKNVFDRQKKKKKRYFWLYSFILSNKKLKQRLLQTTVNIWNHFSAPGT
jgi:hypothetical protein